MAIQAIEYIAPYAVKLQSQSGIPASVTIAQYLLESGTGVPSLLAREYKNPFGVKAFDDWTGQYVVLPTQEYYDGRYVTVQAKFKRYESIDQAIQDRAKLLSGERYQQYLQGVTDPVKYAEGLQKAGYATDPQYANKLSSLIQTYGLTQYDKAGTGLHFAAPNLERFAEKMDVTKWTKEEYGKYALWGAALIGLALLAGSKPKEVQVG